MELPGCSSHSRKTAEHAAQCPSAPQPRVRAVSGQPAVSFAAAIGQGVNTSSLHQSDRAWFTSAGAAPSPATSRDSSGTSLWPRPAREAHRIPPGRCSPGLCFAAGHTGGGAGYSAGASWKPRSASPGTQLGNASQRLVTSSSRPRCGAWVTRRRDRSDKPDRSTASLKPVMRHTNVRWVHLQMGGLGQLAEGAGHGPGHRGIDSRR